MMSRECIEGDARRRSQLKACTMKYAPLARCLLLTFALSRFGCAAKGTSAAKPAAQTALAPSASIFASPLAAQPQHMLTSGRPEPMTVQQLDIYQIVVPMGAVSRSDEFWKRVDEQTVDIATYDLLLKNGMRVGIANNSEWPYFKAIIDQHPTKSRQCSAAGGDGGAVEMVLKEKINFENVFYLNDTNQVFGRTYEHCENAVGISYQPAPRKPGTVRISVCPLVRSLRKHFEVTFRNEEREIQYVAPENLYDLNLITDVPLDGFLVIAPSDHARIPSSLGSSFLVGGNISERFEQVLLLVPRVATKEAIPVAPTEPVAKR